MENIERSPSCEQEDCPVKSSGKCLEGLEPGNCSHFYWVEGKVEIGEEDAESLKEDSTRLINLFSGTELGVKDLGLVTHQYRTNLIIIIGELESGKTTILTSIFDMFQVGKFKQFYFAGSYTQYGFEMRCHLSRSASRAGEPETDRTTSIEFNFLHIAYKSVDNLKGQACHLLLSDISGERFKMANNSASIMKEMKLLREADHLVYLLDGAKLADKFERNSLLTQAGHFITRAHDNDLFDETTSLMIVFTKCDLLGEVIKNGILEDIKQSFIRRFSAQFPKLQFITIAARPKPPTQDVPFGLGLEDLMDAWRVPKPTPDTHIALPITGERYFDLYALRNV